MSSKWKFLSLLSVFLLVFFVSCSSGGSKKCSKDTECGYGSYCSTDNGKCADFAEDDYKIEITSLEDGAHVSGKVAVDIALGEVSEKLHDGMAVALTVENGNDLQTLKGALSENAVSFELDLSEEGAYKLSAFLVQNPFVKAEITIYFDSETEPSDDDPDTEPSDNDDTAPADEDHDAPDNDTDTAPADEDHDTPDEDGDNEPVEEAKPVAVILSHPQDVSSVATAKFTFESDVEEATFRCKIDANAWESCTTPKVYANLSEGDHTFSLKAVNVGGTESDVVSFSWKIDFTIANIDILAPWSSDKLGNGEADTCKANNYGAKVKDNVIYVGTTQDAVEGEGYGVCFKVGVSNTAAGAKFNVYRKNGENWDAASEETLTDADITNGFVMLSGFALAEGENTLKVVVSGKSEDIADAEYIQKIVVATESPVISWVFPANNSMVFSQSNFLSRILATFEITHSIPELEVELFEGDSSVASLKTGRFGLESLSFKDPEIEDSCSARAFHAVLYDTLNDKKVDSENRNITFDVNAPSIDALSIVGKDGSTITSAVSAPQNPVTVTVNLSDTANAAGDGNRTVTLYTNGGSGTPNKVLAKRENAGTEVVFENIELSEAKHTLKVEVKDCTGNISSTTLDPIAVSLSNPVLTVITPKGKGDDSRWLVLSDLEHLEGAVVENGRLEGVRMEIVSDKALSEITQVRHVFGTTTADITGDALLSDENTIMIYLPALENGKHKFIVNVLDFAGNPGKIGGGDEEYYEVDIVAPIVNSLAFNASSYPVKMTFNIPNGAPETSFTLVATKGEIVKTWQGVIKENGSFEKELNLSQGAWSASLTLTDDHGNVTGPLRKSVLVTADVPDITLKKDDGVTVLNVTSEEKPIWFGSSDFDGECAESSCSVRIRIYAPVGTKLNYGIGSKVGSVTIGAEGFETITVPLSLVTVSMLMITDESGIYSENYYFAATDRTPNVSVSNPVACPKSAEYCNIYDLTDDPSTDMIELAEVGFGYDDDLTPGDGILNFKAKSAIKFVIQNSPTGGFMEIENAPEGFEYVRVPLVKMQGEAIPENYYSADFSNLTVPDTNANGQSDYDLVFVLTTESGFTQRYNIPLHVDLALPEPVSAAPSASTADALLGRLNFAWDPLAAKPYAYEVRYQSYNEGNCSIVDDFDDATIPLTEFAGKVPEPANTQMSYNFFVNAVTNAAGTLTADIHKNGNSYCAAVKAVNAVLADDGRVMAKNTGLVDAGSVKDFGSVKMDWTNIYENSSGFHNFRLKIIGDIDNDGFDDYAIANRFKSDSGIDNERNGFVDIYSGAGHILIKSIRGTLGSNERLGQDISSKTDLNGDGFNDFAYTNQAGVVFVFYGTEDGIDFEGTPATFTAKDASNQANRGLVTGDFNGDGCDDIIVSAPTKKAGSNNNAGEVYVYFGCREGSFAGDEPDLTFTGNANAKIGNSGIAAVGDLNNDGKTDFAIGSADDIYILYGGSAEATLTPTFTLSANSYPGYYMSKGDFNGDGITDFVYNVSTESRIFYGSNSGIKSTPDLRLNNFSALYDNYGPAPTYKALAVATEVKDLNGDGADDLVITSSTGILIYYTYTDSETGVKQLKAQSSIFDGFSVEPGTNSKIMMLNDTIIFCNNSKETGNCERLEI